MKKGLINCKCGYSFDYETIFELVNCLQCDESHETEGGQEYKKGEFVADEGCEDLTLKDEGAYVSPLQQQELVEEEVENFDIDVEAEETEGVAE